MIKKGMRKFVQKIILKSKAYWRYKDKRAAFAKKIDTFEKELVELKNIKAKWLRRTEEVEVQAGALLAEEKKLTALNDLILRFAAELKNVENETRQIAQTLANHRTRNMPAYVADREFKTEANARKIVQ